MMEFVSWNDYPIYELEKKIHVPNHQLRLTMSGDVLEIPLFLENLMAESNGIRVFVCSWLLGYPN